MKSDRNILTDLFNEFAEFPLSECGESASPIKRYPNIRILYWHDPWPISPWIDSKIMIYDGNSPTPIILITYSEEAMCGAEDLVVTEQKNISTYLLPLVNDLTNFLRPRIEVGKVERVDYIDFELFRNN